MPITEALKKLIKTITGKNAVGETIDKLVQNLNDNYPEGGGDSYETVAEIEVGTMQTREELPGLYYYQTSFVNNLPKTDLYLNSCDILMEYVEDQGLDNWLHNFSSAGEIIETPAYGLSADNDTLTIMASDDELSNTTVKILKKVSGGGEGGAAPLFVTITPSGANNGVIDIPWAAIYAAHMANRIVFIGNAELMPGQKWLVTNIKYYSEQDIYYAQSIGCNDDKSLPMSIDANSTGANGIFFRQYRIPTYSGGDAGNVLTVNSDGTLGWVSPAVANHKPSYEFHFTVTEDQQHPGEYDITAGSGVTYAAIAAAMQATPNVYAIVDFDGENRYLFSDIDTTYGVIRSTGLYYGVIGGSEMFSGLRIKVMSDDSFRIDVKPLQTASI